MFSMFLGESARPGAYPRSTYSALWFVAERAAPPDELRLELKGRRRKHVEAYWDGCVFAI